MHTPAPDLDTAEQSEVSFRDSDHSDRRFAPSEHRLRERSRNRGASGSSMARNRGEPTQGVSAAGSEVNVR